MPAHQHLLGGDVIFPETQDDAQSTEKPAQGKFENVADPGWRRLSRPILGLPPFLLRVTALDTGLAFNKARPGDTTPQKGTPPAKSGAPSEIRAGRLVLLWCLALGQQVSRGDRQKGH